MKKTIIIIILVSITLVQCYSQYQYHAYELEYEDFENLYSVTTKDKATYRFEKNKYMFRIVSDSLIIIQPNKEHGYEILYERKYTINLNDVESVELTEINGIKTISFVVGSGLLVLVSIGLIHYLTSDHSPFTGMGLL